MADDLTLEAAVGILASFLTRVPLTNLIGSLEHSLDGATSREAVDATAALDIDPALLRASVLTRENLGRLNDLIHAVGISLLIPHILQDDERITNRPSLAAGNDPTRPYDLETDRRVAEFKFAVWTGSDAMRKRQTFKDFVHLAADTSGRRAVLYVIGSRPISFLRTTRSSAAWGLDRSPATRQLFTDQFGDLSVPIGEFVNEQSHVEVVDMSELEAELFSWT
jgi:hypothetical protein